MFGKANDCHILVSVESRLRGELGRFCKLYYQLRAIAVIIVIIIIAIATTVVTLGCLVFYRDRFSLCRSVIIIIITMLEMMYFLWIIDPNCLDEVVLINQPLHY